MNPRHSVVRKRKAYTSASLNNDAIRFHVKAIDEAEAPELLQHAIEPSAQPAIASGASWKTR
ncbi:MAG: hypothetical protein KGM47_03015 [Acidobacteriota bacterium]|nr:hypothetical protein [Acidobacteriota bacterium]